MPNLSNIAQIETLLNDEQVTPYIPLLSRPLVSTIVKNEVDAYRQMVLKEKVEVDNQALLMAIASALHYYSTQRLQRVVNAAGILVHTNIGRSPISSEVWEESQEVVSRYCNLEINLMNGKRGNRMGLLPQLLQTYFGGESSLVINNNAAAIYLILRTLAKGKEVIVSRGEQVQIGGGFRVPEILEESGAILRDVGTTNITTIEDYLGAVNENTAMVLVVHQSNYYIEGFTQHVDIRALAAKLPEHVMLVVDQGSANQHSWVPGEPTVNHYLRIGADLVCCSADKMLGSSQGGIIVGQKDLINQLAKHPMMRTFRPGKETYAVLEKMLISRLNQEAGGEDRIAKIVEQPQEWHIERAQRLVNISPEHLSMVEAKFLIGGGTTPRAQYDTWAVVLDERLDAVTWLKKLREHQPPIIGVTQKAQTMLYPVALFDDEFEIVADFLRTVFAEMANHA